MAIVPSTTLAQQELSPVEVGAAQSVSENARADTLDEWARALYSTPSKFRDAAKLHQRAAMVRGEDPRAAASYRSAAWLYSAAHDDGMATKMMVKAADRAAESGRVADAANFYIDAALLAVADERYDKVPTILSRVHVVLSAPALAEEQRTEILRRIGGDTRVAHLDTGRRVNR
jgi:hypothetical protein